MIRKIVLNNFKSFKNFRIDFDKDCKSIVKNAFIFGETSSGKSNLLSVIFFLKKIIYTLVPKNDDKIHNLDGLTKYFLNEFNKTYNLKSLINEFKTINSEENMKIELKYTFNNLNGLYKVHCDNTGVVYEALFYPENIRVYEFFLDNDKKSYLNNDNINLVKKIKDNFGNHTVLAIVNDIMVHETVNSFPEIYRIINEFSEMLFFTEESAQKYNKMNEGIIHESLLNILIEYEEIVRTFLVNIYSDIKDVYYHIEKENDGLFSYKLMISRKTYDQIISIPYNLESSGIKTTLFLIPLFYSLLCKRIVVIDDIDKSLSEEILSVYIKQIIKYNNGQFICSFRNTTLVKELSPDDLFIIDIDGSGKKRVSHLSDFRLEKHNNISNKLSKGLFGGVSIIGYLDFSDFFKNA